MHPEQFAEWREYQAALKVAKRLSPLHGEIVRRWIRGDYLKQNKLTCYGLRMFLQMEARNKET